MRSARSSVAFLAVLLATGLLAVVAFARSAPAPQLSITAGSARIATQSGRHPALAAHFTVAARAHGAPAHFTAWVKLAASRRSVVLAQVRPRTLKAGHRATLHADATLKRPLAKVRWAIEGCIAGPVSSGKRARTTCRRLGSYDLAPGPATSRAPVRTTPVTTTTTPLSPPQVPASPISVTVNTPTFVPDGLGQYEGTANSAGSDSDTGGFFTSGYYAVVPPSYDPSNQTPETLVVWLHGCYGSARQNALDLTTQFDSDRPYIFIAINGPEAVNTGAGPVCWDTADQTDVNQVMTDITNAETHFNLDRRRIIISGDSSGGDLAWQTIFTHAATFAGILADNTNPVRDNTFGPDGIAAAIAGAAWRFNGLQLSHTDDDLYHVDRCGYSGSPSCPSDDPTGVTNPDAGVRPQIDALDAAGFPIALDVIPGYHYNPDTPANCEQTTPSTCTGGDNYETVHDLLDTVGTDGWSSPPS